MTTYFLLLVFLSLCLDLKGVVIYGLEFKNLNTTVTVDSGSSVGELVFTLKTSDDRRRWAITLDTKSKYFELNPADRRRVVVKSCLPAGLTEVLEFSSDRQSNDDNGKLTINVVSVTPVYNIPSEVLVQVDSQSLIIDVLHIKFANAGECISFLCDVVSKNVDKKFWIAEGTSLIRTYLRDLRYNFKYELDIRCLDSGISKTAPVSDNNLMTVSVAFTDDPASKSKAAPAFFINTTTKPDTLLFGEKPDVFIVNENNDPYGFSGEDAEVAMLSDGIDAENVDNDDTDEVSLKRFKRSGVSTTMPAVASNATNTVIRVKPRCFCSSNFPRPGPNGFMIRKYNPVRVTPVVAMTTVPTTTMEPTSAPDTSTTTTDAATTDVETSTVMTSTETTTPTTMTTTVTTSTTTTTSTTDSTTTSTTTKATTAATTTLTTTEVPTTPEATTTSTTTKATTAATTKLTTTEVPTTPEATTTSTTTKATTTATSKLTTTEVPTTPEATTKSTTTKATTTATSKLTTTVVPTTLASTTTSPQVTTTQTTEKTTTSVPSTSKTTTSTQGTTTTTTASATSTTKVTTGAVTTSEARTSTPTSATSTTSSSVPSTKASTAQSSTSTSTRQDTTAKITTTIQTTTGTDTSTTEADSTSMEMTSSASGSVSGSAGTTQSQSVASQATTAAAPAPTNTGAQVGETPTLGFLGQIENIMAICAAGGVAGLAGIGLLVYKFGMVNKCRHSSSVGSAPSGTTDLTGLSSTTVNPLSASPTAPLTTNTQQVGITPVGS